MFAVKKKPQVDHSKQRRALMLDVLKMGLFFATIRAASVLLNGDE